MFTFVYAVHLDLVMETNNTVVENKLYLYTLSPIAANQSTIISPLVATATLRGASGACCTGSLSAYLLASSNTTFRKRR